MSAPIIDEAAKVFADRTAYTDEPRLHAALTHLRGARSRSRYRLAGQGRRGSRHAWPAGEPAGCAQQDRVPDRHARFAAVLIGLWAPGRDGKQLRLVREFTERTPQRDVPASR
jgi:hypothetical protein